MCRVFFLATAPWCISSILGNILKFIPVPLKTHLKPTAEVEGRKECPAEKGVEERTSLTEADYRKQEVDTYEEGVNESTAREETILKTEIMEQIEKTKEVVSVSYREDRQVEIIEQWKTDYEAEQLEWTGPYKPEKIEKEMSQWSASPTLKGSAHSPAEQDVAPPPEMSHLLQKKVSSPDVGVTSEKEAYKKKEQAEEAGLPTAYLQTRVTESLYHEEIQDSAIEELKSKKVTTSKKLRALTEVICLKQDGSVEGKADVPQTTLSHPAAVSPTMVSSSQDMVKTPKTSINVCDEDILPLDKPSLLSEDASIKQSRDGSRFVTDQIPSPEERRCSEEDISPAKKSVLPTKHSSPTLSEAVFGLIEDLSLEEDTPVKKPIPSVPAPVKTSQVQQISPSLRVSEEANNSATEATPTRADDKKAKKPTQKTDQQALDTGI